MLSRVYYVVVVIVIFRNHFKNGDLAGFVMTPTVLLLIRAYLVSMKGDVLYVPSENQVEFLSLQHPSGN
jgi:hypothetical protein